MKKKVVVAEEEDPRLRWAFVRKVYSILALQFAATAGIAAAACYVRAVPRFFEHGRPAAVWPTFIAIAVSPLIGAPLPLSLPSDLGSCLLRAGVGNGKGTDTGCLPFGVCAFFFFFGVCACAAMIPMIRYRERHPVNLVLLGVFTLCCSLSIAVSASTTVGMMNCQQHP